MRIITDLTVSPWPGERSIITIGAYDGVHLGHQAVIADVRKLAKTSDARSAVVTFDRHPASIVRPESAPQLLTDLDQKLELLAATGVDATVVVHFDEAQSREDPLVFAQRVLVDCLATSIVVVGDDFHFGRDRRGNVGTLRELGAREGFEVQPLSLVQRTDGPDEPISSTAIRRALAGGQVELAASMLGHLFEARGVVVQDEGYTQLRTNLSAKLGELAQLRTQFGENSPRVQSARAELTALRDSLRGYLAGQIAHVRSQIAAMESAGAAIDARVAAKVDRARAVQVALVSPDAEAQMLRRDAIRAQLRQMEQRRRELLVYAEVYEPALTVLDPPHAGDAPEIAHRSARLVLAAFGALLVGFSLSIMLDRRSAAVL